MNPTPQQLEYARRLVGWRSTSEIQERMEKLVRIGKGAGYPMYESLRIILAEKQNRKELTSK